ncbi:VTC domain-containing protein [Delphinella strobiligena]|nr:VTC domain-containing protein [Delphinella strobiligena]
MKFGTTLRKSIYEPWKDQYIDYTKLKKLLREDDSPSGSPVLGQERSEWTDDDAQAFFDELVNKQLEKVKKFHKSTYQKLNDRCNQCESKLEPVATSIKAAEPNEQAENEDSEQSNQHGKKALPNDDERTQILKQVLEELDGITKDINELEKYSRINYTGFLKIAKKHDRKRGGRVSSVRPLVKSMLAEVEFNKEDYSPLLYRLSAMYSFCHTNLEAKELPVSTTESTFGGERYTSHKFWVHMDNLLEVKTVILRRLPVLVYNPQTSKIAEGSQKDPTLTSIYFDNHNFSLYTDKVDHKSDASSVRLRWFGQLSQKPEIVFEKKTVKTDGTSEDERFPIKEKYIQPFLKGEEDMAKTIEKRRSRQGNDSAEVNAFEKSITDIQSFIKEKDLQPVLRANYTRTAFQIPGDDRVRISLDTNLAFIREDAIDPDRPCRDPDDWHRTDIDNAELEWPFGSIRKGELSKFPHALLEIKVKNDKNYEWVDDLMNSHLVYKTPRFSKFVHGVAQLFEDNVNTFPFWLSALEEDIRQDPEDAFKKEQALRRKQEEDVQAVGSLLKDNGGRRGSRVPGQLSPVGSPSQKTVWVGPNSTKRASQPSQSLGSIARSAPTGLDNVAQEADSDEDGEQASRNPANTNGNGHVNAHTPSALGSLFPAFSTSKYAQHRRNRDHPVPASVQKPEYWIKDQGPVKVEAKVWLANQRTFIKWQHVTVLLASLSLGLFNAAGEENDIARGLALVYTIIAVFTGVWGWAIYMWRSKLIMQRSGKDFDALTGPVVVCVGLVFALCLNFGFKYKDAMNRNYGKHPAQNNSTLAAIEPVVAGIVEHVMQELR